MKRKVKSPQSPPVVALEKVVEKSSPQFAIWDWVVYQNSKGIDCVVQFSKLLDKDTAEVVWTEKESNRYDNVPLKSIFKATNNQLARHIDALKYKADDRDYWIKKYEAAAKRIGEDILEMGFQGAMMMSRQVPPPLEFRWRCPEEIGKI